MADDKLNEGSEEEKKNSADSQSDEDFGLPDLEFEELEELDFNLDEESDTEKTKTASGQATDEDAGVEDLDMSGLDEVASADVSLSDSGLLPGDLDPPESALDEGIEEVEDVLDSAQLISDRLGDIDVEDEAAVDVSSGIDFDALLSGTTTESETASFDPSDMPDLSATLEEESGINESSDEISNDILANIDSPDDLAALGLADEDKGTESTLEPVSTDIPESESSLFSADALDGGGEDSDSSIFATDSMSMEAESPAGFEAQEKPTLPPNYKPYAGEEKSASFMKVIIIGALVFVAIGFGLMWLYNQTIGDEKQIVKTEKTQKATPKKNTKKRATTPKKKVENKAADINSKPKNNVKTTPAKKTPPVKKKSTPKSSKPKPSTANKPVAQTAQPGQIVRVQNGAGRSYIIIGSFVDEDLAMDYAKELSEQGKGIKIINPFGKTKRYRVSIADYDTYNSAASKLGSFKGEFGDQVWALKY